jgi:SAM-dependent methyltransferase
MSSSTPPLADRAFESTWLALREPFDTAARSTALEARFQRALPSCPRLIDLACGDGNSLRHLAPRLGGVQHWTLIDNDLRLLRALPKSLELWAQKSSVELERNNEGTSGVLRGQGFEAHFTVLQADLARGLERFVEGADAIVCSAFLDLVGAPFLENLAQLLAKQRVLLLATLSVDGRIDLSPRDSDDERIFELFAIHQARDKGLGLALGSRATETLASQLRTLNLISEQATSDWTLPESAREIQEYMLMGFANAANELAPDVANAWLDRRLNQVRVGVSRMTIGHLDVYAEPGR